MKIVRDQVPFHLQLREPHADDHRANQPVPGQINALAKNAAQDRKANQPGTGDRGERVLIRRGWQVFPLTSVFALLRRNKSGFARENAFHARAEALAVPGDPAVAGRPTGRRFKARGWLRGVHCGRRDKCGQKRLAFRLVQARTLHQERDRRIFGLKLGHHGREVLIRGQVHQIISRTPAEERADGPHDFTQ